MALKKRILKFPPTLRRRIYTDRQIAQALQLLSELNNHQRAAEKTGIPRGTLNQWRSRYQTDDEFAERIDASLDASVHLARTRIDPANTDDTLQTIRASLQTRGKSPAIVHDRHRRLWLTGQPPVRARVDPGTS